MHRLIIQNLLTLLTSHRQRYSLKTLYVAYSGGLDSTVLLHALQGCHRELVELSLQAIHVNHGLQTDAAQWAEHCQQFCQQLDIPIIIKVVSITRLPGESLEAQARLARYQVMAQLVDANSAIVTAHHQDDQAETLLIQLFRGAGPRGLAAMPAQATLGNGWLLRPLLSLSRAQLQDYAVAHQLQWVEDRSNRDTQFARNYLRHDVLPILQQRWPKIPPVLSRTARLCAETMQLCDEIAQQDLATVTWGKPRGKPTVLSVSTLCRLSRLRQRNVLLYWLRCLDFPAPHAKLLTQIQDHLLLVSPDRMPKVTWKQVMVQRYRDQIYASLVGCSVVKQSRLLWDLMSRLVISDVEYLTARLSQGQGLSLQALRNKVMTIRFREGGERCPLPGRQGRHQLKKLLQQARVPPWERDRIPLLFADDDLACVVGYWVCSPYEAQGGEASVVIERCRLSVVD